MQIIEIASQVGTAEYKIRIYSDTASELRNYDIWKVGYCIRNLITWL